MSYYPKVSFSSLYCIKDSKLTSEIQNFVEMEHLAAKQQLKGTEIAIIRGVVKQFWGVVKIFARAHTILIPFPEILHPPLQYICICAFELVRIQ